MIAFTNYFADARVKSYVDMLLDSGHQVDVFALGETCASRDGATIFSLASKPGGGSVLGYTVSLGLFFLRAAFRVTLCFAHRRHRIIHVHNMPDFLVFAAIIPKLLGAKVILDVHDTTPEAFATKLGLSLSHPVTALLRFQERLSCMFADHVITTNDLQREVLMGHGVPGSKISVVMNIANPDIFGPVCERTRSDGSLTLVYHGTIAQRLGPDTIVRAVGLARSDCANLKLLLIGGGDFMPEILHMVNELALDGTVEYREWMPVESLPGYLSRADFGVIGNRGCTETLQNWMLPIKMLQYAAMEIPVIAPRLRIIEEYFDDESVIFYEPDDPQDMARCIRLAYADRDLGMRLKLGLRCFNEKHGWNAEKRKYLLTISSLAGR